MTSSHQRGNFLGRIGPTVATWQACAVGKSSPSSRIANLLFLQQKLHRSVSKKINDPTGCKISDH